MTVRDMVSEIQREVRDTDLQPSRACELLAKLTALIGNVNAEVREAEMAFAVVLLACLDVGEAANRARIRAETSEEYKRKREARDCKELVVEMIRSLKFVIKGLTEEMRLSR